MPARRLGCGWTSCAASLGVHLSLFDGTGCLDPVCQACNNSATATAARHGRHPSTKFHLKTRRAAFSPSSFRGGLCEPRRAKSTSLLSRFICIPLSCYCCSPDCRRHSYSARLVSLSSSGTSLFHYRAHFFAGTMSGWLFCPMMLRLSEGRIAYKLADE